MPLSYRRREGYEKIVSYNCIAAQQLVDLQDLAA